MANDVTNNFSDAIAALQEAQGALVNATNRIEEHNINESAHADIREAIEEIKSSDSIYTRDQIEELVATQLTLHTDKDFKTAHSGWDAFETTLEERLEALVLRVQAIEDKLDGRDQEASDLQAQLQAIEDRYAPLLEQLSNALIAAQSAGSDELADQYRATIASTLDQKKADLLACITNWQNSHGDVSAPSTDSAIADSSVLGS